MTKEQMIEVREVLVAQWGEGRVNFTGSGYMCPAFAVYTYGAEHVIVTFHDFLPGGAMEEMMHLLDGAGTRYFPTPQGQPFFTLTMPNGFFENFVRAVFPYVQSSYCLQSSYCQ